jgi:hypothetical protein
VTDTAADAAFAETALVFLLFRAVKTGFNAIGLAFFQHRNRSVVAYFRTYRFLIHLLLHYKLKRKRGKITIGRGD